MFSRNKKADNFGYVLFAKILLAVIMATTVVWAISNFFGGCTTAEAYNSFVDMVTEINLLKDGDLKAVEVDMDKKSVIAFFNADSEKVILNWETYVRGDTLFGRGDVEVQMIFNRPSGVRDEGFICLFQDVEKQDTTRDENVKQTYIGDSNCLKTNAPNFIGDCSKAGSIYKGCEGGIIMQRNLLGGQTGKYKHPRRRAMYIERYKTSVGVCFETPCITKEMKEEIDRIEGEKAKNETIKNFKIFVSVLNGCIRGLECEEEITLTMPHKGYRVMHKADGTFQLEYYKETGYELVSDVDIENIPSCDNTEHTYVSGAKFRVDNENKCLALV